jgi:hypothetical protein
MLFSRRQKMRKTVFFRCVAFFLSLLMIATPLFAQLPDTDTEIETGVETTNETDETISPDEQGNETEGEAASEQLYEPASQEPPATQDQADQQVQSTSTVSIAEAQEQARLDAKADVNGSIWFAVGCLLGCVGWVLAYAIQPNPPAMRLVGKSPEYVAAYTDAYKEAGKKVQAKQALVGCIVGTGITVGLQLMLTAMTL